MQGQRPIVEKICASGDARRLGRCGAVLLVQREKWGSLEGMADSGD
jgi:hypothetical protein